MPIFSLIVAAIALFSAPIQHHAIHEQHLHHVAATAPVAAVAPATSTPPSTGTVTAPSHAGEVYCTYNKMLVMPCEGTNNGYVLATAGEYAQATAEYGTAAALDGWFPLSAVQYGTPDVPAATAPTAPTAPTASGACVPTPPFGGCPGDT
jgi:hypothetical protein